MGHFTSFSIVKDRRANRDKQHTKPKQDKDKKKNRQNADRCAGEETF